MLNISLINLMAKRKLTLFFHSGAVFLPPLCPSPAAHLSFSGTVSACLFVASIAEKCTSCKQCPMCGIYHLLNVLHGKIIGEEALLKGGNRFNYKAIKTNYW